MAGAPPLQTCMWVAPASVSPPAKEGVGIVLGGCDPPKVGGGHGAPRARGGGYGGTLGGVKVGTHWHPGVGGQQGHGNTLGWVERGDMGEPLAGGQDVGAPWAAWKRGTWGHLELGRSGIWGNSGLGGRGGHGGTFGWRGGCEGTLGWMERGTWGHPALGVAGGHGGTLNGRGDVGAHWAG